MKLSDQDLERMFKSGQEHSVLAACRDIWNHGYASALEDVAGAMPVEPAPMVVGPVPAGDGSTESRINALVEAATLADQV